MIAVAALNVLLTGGFDDVLPTVGARGICMPSASTWPVPPLIGMLISLAANALVIVMMIMVNSTFNVLRAMTWLHTGFYAVMAAAVPSLALRLNTGPLLALAVICCVYLMFSSYDNPGKTRNVFLTFFILSAGSATQICFAVFIPVFWVICTQVRIFSMRTFLASVLGIVTPWILMFGSGLRSVADLHMPEIESIFSLYTTTEVIYLGIVNAFTAIIAITSTSLNIWKTIAYNARARAFNGALTLLSLTTIVAMAVDFRNLTAYIPLLDMCSAYQLTHYFINHRYDRQYAAILAICGIYILLYLWRITL